MSRRLPALGALLLLGALATPSAGQEAAPSPSPTPSATPSPSPQVEEGAPGTPEAGGEEPGVPGPEGPEYDPAEEGEVLTVERPGEIERLRAELDRIRTERAKLVTEEQDVTERVRALSKEELSPVLAPRREVLALTLDDAIRMALANNPDYLVSLLQARSAAESVPEAEGSFDPSASFTGTWARGRPPFFSSNPFSGFPVGLQTASYERYDLSTVLSKRFLLGTQVSVTWNESRQKTENQFSLNPQYAPSLELQVVQPLLRGFGLDYNEAPIKIAENTSLSSDAGLAQTLTDGVLSVEQAYWDVIRSEGELRSQERSLSSAIKFLADQREREKQGAAAKLDLVIAQAGVAQRREGVISAENALEASRDNLLRLVRPSDKVGDWDLFVVPLDKPWLLPEPELDASKALEQARERRPDYYQSLLAVDTARRTLVMRENERLPQVDFVTTLREDGLGGNHGKAWTAMTSGRFYSWTAGLRIDLPLFLRSERARARAAKLDLERAEASMRKTEADLVLQVRTAVRDIYTAKARVAASRESRILAARRLKATRTQVEHGVAVPRDVLDDLASLASAESGEIQAYIQYRLSLSGLKRVQGNLLDQWLDVLDPRVRRALNRDPYQD